MDGLPVDSGQNLARGQTIKGMRSSTGPYSPFIFKNLLNLVLQIFLHLEAFESNTTFDWLNHMV